MYLTESFLVLLLQFQPVFTKPSFATFQLLMTGWILSVRRRYVTDLIVSSGSTDNGHFSDYHRFFSHASWDIDQLWKILSKQRCQESLIGECVCVSLLKCLDHRPKRADAKRKGVRSQIGKLGNCRTEFKR